MLNKVKWICDSNNNNRVLLFLFYHYCVFVWKHVHNAFVKNYRDIHVCASKYTINIYTSLTDRDTTIATKIAKCNNNIISLLCTCHIVASNKRVPSSVILLKRGIFPTQSFWVIREKSEYDETMQLASVYKLNTNMLW